MASRKKGLSLEEKKAKMLELFYESNQVFQMKELEKIAPKQKGVISQSVKEVTQMLVDDGFVECEKIGTFVCYWAFPSKALLTRKARLEKLEKQAIELKEKIEQGRADITEARNGKEESAEREELLVEVRELSARMSELENKLALYAEFDPEVLKQVAERTTEAVDNANKWTDNIFAMTKWCKSKFQMDKKLLYKQFGIPEELDYIENA